MLTCLLGLGSLLGSVLKPQPGNRPVTSQNVLITMRTLAIGTPASPLLHPSWILTLQCTRFQFPQWSLGEKTGALYPDSTIATEVTQLRDNIYLGQQDFDTVNTNHNYPQAKGGS